MVEDSPELSPSKIGNIALYPYVIHVHSSHLFLVDSRQTVPEKWRHGIISSPNKCNSLSLDDQRGNAKICAFANLTNKFLAPFVTLSSGNYLEFKVVFVLGGH